MDYNNNYNDYGGNKYNNPGTFAEPINDINAINSIMEENGQFLDIINARVRGLKQIAQSYEKNEYEEAIVTLSYIKDLGVINDFFNFAFVKKKETLNVNLNSDQVIRAFPMILSLSTSKYDDYFKTGIETAWVILKLFSDKIIDAKKFGAGSGVDLAREEKLRKYENIIEYFIQLRNSQKVNENSQRDIKNLNLIQFLRELDHFLRMSSSG